MTVAKETTLHPHLKWAATGAEIPFGLEHLALVGTTTQKLSAEAGDQPQRFVGQVLHLEPVLVGID